MQMLGEIILHAFDFLKREKGTEGVVQVLEEVGYNLSDIRPGLYYPFAKYLQVLEQIEKIMGSSGDNISFCIGYDRAKKLGLLEFKNRNPHPLEALKRVEERWSHFNNFRRMELKNLENISADIFLYDYTSHPLYCQRTEGFITGLLMEVCQVNGVKTVEANCIFKGDEFCRFDTQWCEPEQNILKQEYLPQPET